jgi:flagellar basal-body rod modification protein FlgD
VIVQTDTASGRPKQGMTGSVAFRRRLPVAPSRSPTAAAKRWFAPSIWAAAPLAPASSGTARTRRQPGEAGTYTFTATATINGTSTALATYLPATVNSVTISQTGGELMLNLAGGQRRPVQSTNHWYIEPTNRHKGVEYVFQYRP